MHTDLLEALLGPVIRTHLTELKPAVPRQFGHRPHSLPAVPTDVWRKPVLSSRLWGKLTDSPRSHLGQVKGFVPGHGAGERRVKAPAWGQERLHAPSVGSPASQGQQPSPGGWRRWSRRTQPFGQ